MDRHPGVATWVQAGGVAIALWAAGASSRERAKSGRRFVERADAIVDSLHWLLRPSAEGRRPNEDEVHVPRNFVECNQFTDAYRFLDADEVLWPTHNFKNAFRDFVASAAILAEAATTPENRLYGFSDVDRQANYRRAKLLYWVMSNQAAGRHLWWRRGE